MCYAHMRTTARAKFSVSKFSQIKGTVSGYKGRVLLFSETFESTAQRDVRRAQHRWPHGNYHAHSCRSIELYAPYDGR